MSQLPNHHRAGTIRALSPLRDFLRTEASGATLLALGAISALIWRIHRGLAHMKVFGTAELRSKWRDIHSTSI